MRRYGNCNNGMHSNWASAATGSVECVISYGWVADFEPAGENF